jgi:tRNA pseudouridine55 synthase
MSLPELLLIDKPLNITSFDVIRRLRRQYSENHAGEKAPKMGHAGTLDPLATGLMIIGVGPGTKRLTNLTKLNKEYVAEIRIGEQRSTGDLEGDILDEAEVSESLKELQIKVASALEDMVGELELPVSAYSAIKVDGVPMYRRARKAEREGELVSEVPVRIMKVFVADLFTIKKGEQKPYATVRFYVGSGTYIRSLAEELGRRIGYPATLQNLRRTKVGEFDIDSAQEIESVFTDT